MIKKKTFATLTIIYLVSVLILSVKAPVSDEWTIGDWTIGEEWTETPPPSNNAPQYGAVSIDQWIAGQEAVFGCGWTDDSALRFGFLSHNSSSGIWMNRTALALSGVSDVFIDSFRLTSLISEVVGYKFYANDSAGVLNATNIYTLTTVPHQSGGGTTWIQNVESQKLVGLSIVAGIAVLALITVTVILPKESISRRRGF